MSQTPKKVPIALLAGKGDLPRHLISVFQNQGRSFVVVAFKGQTEEDLVKQTEHQWVHLGEVGKALSFMKQHDICEIVMAGGITRPSMTEIRPDWEGVKWLARLGKKALGDDGLLTSLIGMLEEHGYTIVGPHTLLESLLAPEGPLTADVPDEQAMLDIERGQEVLQCLSSADVGQAIVVQQGLVLGIEAIEGTDGLIERASVLKRSGLGGVLVKFSKPQQEKRVDLPTIGVETIRRVAAAGLRGIAIEAGRTLIVNAEEVKELAAKNNLFVIGIKGS